MKKFHALCLGALLAALPASLQAERPLQGDAPSKAVGGMHVPGRSRQATPGLYRAASGSTVANPLTKALRRARTPLKRVTPKGAPLYGYLSYNNTMDFEPGMYEINAPGTSLLWEDHLYEEYDGIVMLAGWLRNGTLCGTAQSVSPYGITGAANLEVDLLSGKVKVIEPIYDSSRLYFSIAAYDDTEDAVYGLYREADGYFSFGKGTYDQAGVLTITPVRRHCEEDLYLTSLTFCQDDNTMYAMRTLETGDGLSTDFVKVSRSGVATKIADISLDETIGNYFSGLIWSPADQLFYWNPNFFDEQETTALYTLDREGRNLTPVEVFETGDQYAFFITTDGRRDPQAPARATLKGLDFPGGSASGTVTYVMPTLLEDGSPAPAALSWTATCGTAVQNGTAAPGSEVAVSYTGLPEGFNTFGFVASAGDKAGFSLVHSAYIGQDDPLAPGNVTLTRSTLSWDPVTEGVNGGYVDKDNMSYIIYDKNRDRVATVTDTHYDVNLSEEASLEAYTYYVAATYGTGHVSAEASSNTLVAGKPLDLPAGWTPTQEQSELFTIYTAPGSEDAAWRYLGEPDRFACGWNPNGPCDAWVFTPPFRVSDADRYYTVTFQSRIGNTSYPDEHLTVWAGTDASPDAMTEIVIDDFTPENDYSLCRGVFRLPAGTGVIGFHCTSPRDQEGILIREIAVTDNNITDKSPAPVGDVSVKAFGQGELRATVTLTLPSRLIDGSDIPAGTSLTATASSSAGEGTATGKPGEKITIDLPTIQGDNTVSVFCSLDGANSVPVTVVVYTGVSIPVAVDNLTYKVADDMMSVTIEWDPVTSGVLGGYVDPDGVTYNVYRVFRTMWGDLDLEFIDSDIRGNKYTLRFPEDTDQDYFTIGVSAVNAAGESEDVTTFSAVMGTPYTVPCGENFRDISPADPLSMKPYVVMPLTTYPTVSYRIESPERFDDSLPDLTGSYFCFYVPEGREGYAALSLPRFTTADLEKCSVKVTGLTGTQYYAPIEVWALTPAMTEAVLIGTLNNPFRGDHFEDILLPAEMLDQPWVELQVRAGLTPDKWVMAFRAWEVTGTRASVGTAGADTLRVTAGKGTLAVSGAGDSAVSVYTADGRRVAASSGDATFRLPAGIYLVKAAGRSLKTVVR